MYCSHCGQRLYYQDLDNSSWCDRCAAIVEASNCKISNWNLIAVFTMLWSLHVVA